MEVFWFLYPNWVHRVLYHLQGTWCFSLTSFSDQRICLVEILLDQKLILVWSHMLWPLDEKFQYPPWNIAAFLCNRIQLMSESFYEFNKFINFELRRRNQLSRTFWLYFGFLTSLRLDQRPEVFPENDWSYNPLLCLGGQGAKLQGPTCSSWPYTQKLAIDTVNIWRISVCE